MRSLAGPSARDSIGVAPSPLEWQPPGVGRYELIYGLWPPRARRIDLDRRRGHQQRLRNFPQPLDALGRTEQRVIAAHGVEDESLVGLEHVATEASFLHRELKTLLVETHPRAGLLAVERQRHPGLVSEIECQVIRALRTQARIHWEHAFWRFAEGDRYNALAGCHPLAGAQEKGHPRPAPIVDEALERDEGFGLRFRVDAGLLAVTNKLASHHVGRVDRHERAKDLVFFFADRAWRE